MKSLSRSILYTCVGLVGGVGLMAASDHLPFLQAADSSSNSPNPVIQEGQSLSTLEDTKVGTAPALKGIIREGQTLPTTNSVLQNTVKPTGLFNAGTPNSFADLADKVSPSVVNISTTKLVKKNRRPASPFGGGARDPFLDDFFDHFYQGGPTTETPQKSLGSGFIINADGYILTNNHVVDGADEIQVQVNGKKKFNAKLVGTDVKTDLAVIKLVDKVNLSYVNLGNSDQMRVGDWVMAVGNPFGLDHTVTVGIISAKGRVIGAGPYDDFIQTDASINPGNSGGPLFNMQGEVVGVNTAIVSSGQGIGFAIPINIAKNLIPQLISAGKVTRAWLGVGIQDMTPELAKSFGLTDEKGALISSVYPGSPAANAGIVAGDVIQSFNGKSIDASHELPNLVAQEPVGKEVPVQILREGKTIDLKVKLGEMEKGEKQADQIPSIPGTGSTELGLACRELTAEERTELGLAGQKQGVLIVSVGPGSSAEGVGVQEGDVLLSINNTKVTSVTDFTAAAKKIKSGEIARLFIRRGDSTIYLAFPK